MTMGVGGIFGNPYGSRRRKDGLFDPQLETPDQVEMAPPIGADFKEKPQGLLGFWQGGDKFTARDGIAGLLAAVGDAFAQENGMEGSAVSGLTGGRAKAMAEAKAAKQQARVMAAFRNKGMSDDDITIAMLNPEAFGTQAASRFNERITNKAGDRIEIGPDGKPRTVYQDDTPEILGVPSMGVYAINRRTGQPFNSGSTTVSEDEWKKANPVGGAGSGPRPFRR